MTCPYCTTKLPVDNIGQRVTCPKCGSMLIVAELKATKSAHAGMLLIPVDQLTYEEDPFFDNSTNH